MARRYTIALAPTAFASLRRVANRKTLRELGKAIDGLARERDRDTGAGQAPFLARAQAGEARVRGLEGGPAWEPDLQGKPLAAPLEGVWRIRAARDRYRVLYEIDGVKRRIIVLDIGERRPGEPSDVYRLAARLLRDLTT